MISVHATRGAIASNGVIVESGSRQPGAVVAILRVGDGISRSRAFPAGRGGLIIPFPRAGGRVRRNGVGDIGLPGTASRLDLIAAAARAALVATPPIWIGGAFEFGGLVAGAVAIVALGLLSGSWRVAAHAAPGVDRRLLDPAGSADLGGSVRHHRPRLVKPVIRRGSEIIRSGLFLLATLASQSAGPAYSEVWEFDTDGTLLTKPAPSGYGSDNKPYDVEQFPGTPFPHAVGRLAAIYRPMAEGVARAFAGHPGVAAAGLDTDAFARLFTALIDQESRFNPDAVSPTGARGLGQLMPETAAALGVADAFEPMANLRGAARYLAAQLAAFGRVDLALAAYNAGPHRVTRTAGVPPFRETREYVARITRAAGLAGARSGGPNGRLTTENSATLSARNAPGDAPEFVRTRHVGEDPVLLTRADGGPDERADTPISQPRQGTVLEWPN